MIVHRAVWLAPAALNLIALAPLPYGYYIFLRIVVCLAAAFLIWAEYRQKSAITIWSVALAIIAIAFNPIIPIHLTREIWSVLNVLTAGVFLGHLWHWSRPARSRVDPK